MFASETPGLVVAKISLSLFRVTDCGCETSFGDTGLRGRSLRRRMPEGHATSWTRTAPVLGKRLGKGKLNVRHVNSI